MTVVAIETVIEDVLKKAGALATHDRIARDRLKIAVRRVGSKHLYLPLAFGIVSVTMWIYFGGEIVDAFFLSFGIPCVLQIQKRGGCDRRVRLQENFLRRPVKIFDGDRGLADDLEMVMIVAAIEGQVKAP